MTTFTGTLTAQDSSGQTATCTVTINQVPLLTVSYTISPASGPPGTKYTITAQNAGGVGPYTDSLGPIGGVTPVQTSPGVFTITI